MSHSHPTERFVTLSIAGMTCASCELLLERKLKTVPGVKHVEADHRKNTIFITADAKHLPSFDQIASIVHEAGYSLVEEEDPTSSSVAPDQRKWIEIGGSFLIIFALYKFLQAFDLISLVPSVDDALSFGGIFAIGLVAGTSSCLAVTGGLLLALAAKHTKTHRLEAPWEKFRPLLHFNIGRLVSYFVLGGVAGLLGQSIALTTKMTGYMNIIVAGIMLYLALTILEIIPKGSFPLRPPKRMSHWIAGLSESKHPAAPFSLGALTFLLPCGFTQSLQLAALASGSFMTGALMMFTFALGTLPSLLGISAVSSAAKGNTTRVFLRFSGTLVLLLALFNLQSGLALTGIDLSRLTVRNGGQNVAVPVVNAGSQEVSIAVTRSGYVPNNLTIKAGVPVRWKIDGTDAAGCTSIMTIPSLNISQALRRGENIIEFTAPQKGQLAFMCSMGMVRGSFNVI